MRRLHGPADLVAKFPGILFTDQGINVALELPAAAFLAISANTAHKLHKRPFVWKLAGDEQIDSTSCLGAKVHSPSLSPADDGDRVGSQLAVLLGVKRRVDEWFWQPFLEPERDPFDPGHIHQPWVFGELRGHKLLPADAR